MRRRASLNTMTALTIAVLAIAGIVFFGVVMFKGIGTSIAVVNENVDILDAIDVTHLLSTCLEGENDVVHTPEISLADCYSMFPGLKKTDFEFRIENLETGQTVYETQGYDTDSSSPRHSIAINLRDDEEVYVGRLYAQTI